METPLLGAAMIVKNEEARLPRCLASLEALKPVLGEVCIYDTGSTDRTVEIAEAHGARVELGYWDSDFGRARNAALGMLTAKWALIVDADDVVQADLAQLRPALRRWLTLDYTGIDAVEVDVDNVDDQERFLYSIASIRLCRPGRTHYVGAIHERVEPLDGRQGYGAIAPRDMIRVTHLGYESPSAIAARGLRNLEGAEIELKRLTDAGASEAAIAAALVNRARSRQLVADVEGAIRDFVTVRKMSTDGAFRTWAGEELCLMCMQVGAYDDAAILIRELRDEGADDDLTTYLLGLARAGQGRHGEALELFRRVNTTRSVVGITYRTADVLAAKMMAAARVGELDEALACGIALMGKHGQVGKTAKLVGTLWGKRPPSVLAQLISEAGRDHLAEVQRVFRAAGFVDLADEVQRIRLQQSGFENSLQNLSLATRPQPMS